VALGDITARGNLYQVELLASATATNSAPSGAAAGIDVQDLESEIGAIPGVASVWVVSTAGSGTMTVGCRLWGFHNATGEWAPLGKGSTAGQLNDGNVIAEVSADQITHNEPLSDFAHLDRLYCEIESIAGTATAVTVFLTMAKVSV